MLHAKLYGHFVCIARVRHSGRIQVRVDLSGEKNLCFRVGRIKERRVCNCETAFRLRSVGKVSGAVDVSSAVDVGGAVDMGGSVHMRIYFRVVDQGSLLEDRAFRRRVQKARVVGIDRNEVFSKPAKSTFAMGIAKGAFRMLDGSIRGALTVEATLDQIHAQITSASNCPDGAGHGLVLLDYEDLVRPLSFLTGAERESRDSRCKKHGKTGEDLGNMTLVSTGSCGGKLQSCPLSTNLHLCYER